MQKLSQEQLHLMAECRNMVIETAAQKFGPKLTKRACDHIDSAFKRTTCYQDLWKDLQSKSEISRSYNLAFKIFASWIQVIQHEFGFVPGGRFY